MLSHVAGGRAPPLNEQWGFALVLKARFVSPVVFEVCISPLGLV